MNFFDADKDSHFDKFRRVFHFKAGWLHVIHICEFSQDSQYYNYILGDIFKLNKISKREIKRHVSFKVSHNIL